MMEINMKKIFILCSLILIGCGSSGEPYEESYDNGQLKIETSTKDGERHGEFIRYYEDGKIKETGTYVNGTKEGPAVFYWPSGSREERTYVNDTKEGPSVYYWPSGSREERTYVNGTKEGPAVYYYAEGDREEYTYVNGKLEGPSVYYWSDGDRQERTYVNGTKEGPAVFYYADGRTKNQTYVDGKLQSSSYSSSRPGSSSGSQKGLYDLRKNEISFRIVVTDSDIDGILLYDGFSSVYGVEGNMNGTIKDNTLYEAGVMRIGSIDRNGKWIQYDGHTIPRR